MLGERLQELRKDRKMSQRELAEKLNISLYTVSSYERGRSVPDDDIKLKIARIYDISLDYLLGLIDTKHSYKRDMMLVVPKDLNNTEIEKIQDYIDMVVFKSKNTSKK